MVGVLNFPKLPLFSPLCLRKQSRPFISIKASSESSNSQINPASTSTKEEQKPSSASSSTATTFAPPPNFKPPEPKRFAIRPDKTWDIVGAALALFFRWGTGVFVSGYSPSLVSENEIPPGQYCLELGGSKVKETSKIGPRPEKPIEIYEFEGYSNFLSFFFFPCLMLVLIADINCPSMGIAFLPFILPCSFSCFISDEEKIDSVCFFFLFKLWIMADCMQLQLSILSKGSKSTSSNTFFTYIAFVLGFCYHY
ncbi:hypothetical protein CRYUN_Cryun05aG0220400 [Craigia yunnanensis]